MSLARGLKCAARLLPLALAQALWADNVGLRFEVSLRPTNLVAALSGRLFVAVATTNVPEPRLALGRAGRHGLVALALDVSGFGPGKSCVLDDSTFQFPPHGLGTLMPGVHFVQAVLDCSTDLRSTTAPGNWFSATEPIAVAAGDNRTVKIQLTQQVPSFAPKESEFVKFVGFKSELLSQFRGQEAFLKAGIILPADYSTSHGRRYPLWIRIGGLGTRFTAVTNLMSPKSDFRKVWFEKDTPRFILLQLDGAGPYGDPYFVNSDNNGPYGEVLVKEVIPFIEEAFRVKRQGCSRFLSGVSTGGWVALALQVFYPDQFNGAWASCPDPVDFRRLELIDIYSDTNAFINKFGYERPSERNLEGEIVLSVRDEVGVENLLGRENSYTASAEQWGAWNAAYSPRGADGRPVPLFDRHTGKIDPQVAEHWSKYDLRLLLERNWQGFGAQVSRKLHISAGEADQYFLNDAVHLLEESLRPLKPASGATIAYGPRKGHGWSEVSLKEMLTRMDAAEAERPVQPARAAR